LHENLDDAVEREVLEETGVKSKFIGLLGMREIQKFKFNTADLYFVCFL